MEVLQVFVCDTISVGQEHIKMPKQFVLVKHFREMIAVVNLAFVGSNIFSRPPTAFFGAYKLQQALIGLAF